MKQVSAIWRTVAILAICLCLVVSALWITGAGTKNGSPAESPSFGVSALSLWTENAEARTALISYIETKI